MPLEFNSKEQVILVKRVNQQPRKVTLKEIQQARAAIVAKKIRLVDQIIDLDNKIQQLKGL